MEPSQVLDIDILCRVIDNYGDAGVVWRLAKGLERLAGKEPGLDLRIFTDRPELFLQLAGSPGFPVFGLTDWDTAPAGWNGRTARTIIQAFDAPLPGFYRQALMNEESGQAGRRHFLVNLEYLSAEEWTREYHLLPSLSGIPGVDKVFFLPGFIPGTGGLIWSETPPPTNTRKTEARRSMVSLLSGKTQVPGFAPEEALSAAPQDQFWISLFSYEHDYRDLVAALTDRAASKNLNPVILLAPGRSTQGFLEPWVEAGKPFPVILLPFLAQMDYDLLVDSCDFNIVRGEESLARAALSGSPFLWHAYLQEDRHQLVKVQALLEIMRPEFTDADFQVLESCFLSFNDRDSDTLPNRRSTDWQAILDLAASSGGKSAFMEFTKKLSSLGDLSTNLLTSITQSRK